jgi:hypothetical protein
MSRLWLVKVGPVFSCSYGKKTVSTNGVDRIVGVCPINKLRKTSSLPTSHTNLPTLEDAFVQGVTKPQAKPYTPLSNLQNGDKKGPDLDQIHCSVLGVSASSRKKSQQAHVFAPIAAQAPNRILKKKEPLEIFQTKPRPVHVVRKTLTTFHNDPQIASANL